MSTDVWCSMFTSKSKKSISPPNHAADSNSDNDTTIHCPLSIFRCPELQGSPLALSRSCRQHYKLRSAYLLFLPIFFPQRNLLTAMPRPSRHSKRHHFHLFKVLLPNHKSTDPRLAATYADPSRSPNDAIPNRCITATSFPALIGQMCNSG